MLDESKMIGGCDPSDCATCGGCDSNGIDPEQSTVTLTLDDDTEVTCAVLNIFEVDGNSYISLLPLDENGNNTDGEVYLYRYLVENGNPALDNIEDDDEYAAAAEAFTGIMQQMNFQENPFEGIVENTEE